MIMPDEDLKIHSVVACCNNWGIGNKGGLPWSLPKEYAHYKALTTGDPPDGKKNVVIRGRKTWKPLSKQAQQDKKRYNIVLSRTLNPLAAEPVPDAVVSSLEDLVTLLKTSEWKNKVHEIFNIGGSEIYKIIQESPFCGKIYLTRIFADFECDTFFPPLDDKFVLMPTEKFPEVPQGVQEEEGIKWKVEVYVKRSDVVSH